MIEYWLLKKQLGGWAKVSWWDESEHDKAMRSYEAMVASGGYAVRLARVEIVQEKLLDEMIEEVKEEIPVGPDLKVKADHWGIASPKLDGGGWGSPVKAELPSDSVWGGVKTPEVQEHGMAGKVWLGNSVTKEKKRVAPEEVAGMMANGWVKAGPRTVL